MQLKSTYYFLAFSVLASLAFMVSFSYLPLKRLQLYPASAGEAYTFDWTDEGQGGNTKVRIVSDNPLGWQCDVRAGADYPTCGFGLSLLDGNKGINFSSYSSLLMTLSSDSPEPRIRVSLQSWLGGYSRQNNRELQFNQQVIRRDAACNEVVIELENFTVADWWLAKFNPPLEFTQPNLQDVRSFGIEVGPPAPLGIHNFKLEKLELVGRFVSMETWLQGLLTAWLVLVIPYVVYRYINVQKRLIREQRQLERLAHYSNQLDDERARFKEMSTVDNLTGALNRNGFDEALAQLTAALQGKQKAALIVVDLDHFKLINDERGHDVGDVVLRAVAEALKSSLRNTDFLARWGGEEFIVLSPHSEEAGAYALAEKLRAAVADIQLELDPTLKITASLGVGCFEVGEPFEDAFKRIDSALYEAKRSGRNRSILAEDGKPSL